MAFRLPPNGSTAKDYFLMIARRSALLPGPRPGADISDEEKVALAIACGERLAVGAWDSSPIIQDKCPDRAAYIEAAGIAYAQLMASYSGAWKEAFSRSKEEVMPTWDGVYDREEA